MVIEVLLDPELAAGAEDLWGGFLVYAVEVADTGEWLITAKSLGCSDSDVSRTLSGLFNRRVGVIHLCRTQGCHGAGEFAAHATRLRTFSPEGFKRPYMSHATVKQLRKWLDELGLSAGEGPPLPLGAGGLGLGRELNLDGEPWTPGEEDVGEGRPGTAAGAPAPRRASKALHKDRRELRQRLAAARDRMVGKATTSSAGDRAGRPIDVEAAIDVSSSEGYSPSEGHPAVKEEGAPRAKRRHRPLDPLGPRRALEDVGPPIQGPPKDGKKKAPRKKHSTGLEVVKAATRGSTTSSLQKQLMLRAEETALERKQKKSEKKSDKDPSRQLAKILTRVVKGKKETKKKKRKKRRRKKNEEGGGGGGPSGSSGGSPTGSSGASSGSGSDEDGSSSTDSAKMEPPLKKRAMQKPGSVLKLLVDHAKEKLDQTSKIAVSRRDEDDMTQGVRITTYFAIVVKGQLNQSSPQLRELHMLAHALDLLRGGELDSLGDLMASRFISLHQAGLDGNWHAARHLEMIPYDESSAAGAAVVLQARKHAKMAAQVAGAVPPTWKGGGRGKGSGRGGWEDSTWTSDGKARGKKGEKGKGRGKGAWKGQGQGENAGDGKSKEKLPEK